MNCGSIGRISVFLRGHHCRDGCGSCRRYVQRPRHRRKDRDRSADPTNAVAYELRGEAWYMERDRDRPSRLQPPRYGSIRISGGLITAAAAPIRRGVNGITLWPITTRPFASIPATSQSYTSRALEYFNQRDFDLAIGAFTEAIERNPKQAYFALVKRGEAYAAKRDPDHAVAGTTRRCGAIPPPHGPTSCKAPSM